MTMQQARIPAAQGDMNRPSGVAQYLSPVVQDLVALHVNAKQAHWHVRGANFIGVHEFLDTVVANAQAGADEVAERIVALGLPVDARVSTVAARTTTPELSPGFQQSDVTVREMVAQLDATLVTIYAAIEGLEDIDPVSQDIAIAIAQQLDKDRWFLHSHIAEA
ncbi:DNA starvation/stationary phase protection protein Dps [Nonlabens tegetincola]